MSISTSVIVCTYNGEKYIESQLRSIINQTNSPDEIIVNDDCSSDLTVNIIERIIKEEAGIKISLYKNDKNLGYILNFQEGIKKCSGEIILLADQDDIWEKNKIEKIEEFFKNNPQRDMVFTDGNLINSKGEKIVGSLWNCFLFLDNNKKMFDKFPLQELLKHNIITGATVAIKKELLEKILPIPEGFIHDAWFGYIASIEGKLGRLDEKLISYRIHNEQSIGTKRKIIRDINGRDDEIEKLKILYNYAERKKYQVEMKMLEEKYLFYCQRKQYSKNIIKRFKNIQKNKKYYFLYASGRKSMVRDFIGR